MSRESPPLPHADARATQRWLRTQTTPHRRPVTIAIACGTAAALLMIAQAVLLAHILVAVIQHGADIHRILPALCAFLAVSLARIGANALSDRIAFEAGAAFVRALRARILAHLATLGPQWTSSRQAGGLAALAVDSTDALLAYCGSYLPQSALAAIVPLAILAFVIPTDWISAAILVVTAPLIPIFMIVIGRSTEQLNQRQWRTLARLSGHVFDAIEGLTTLKLFGAARAEIETVARISEEYRNATMAVLRVAFLSSLVLEFFATIGVAMVAVYVGFRLYARDMHFLPGLEVLLLAPEYFRTLRNMGTQYHVRTDAIGAAHAIAALLAETPPERPAIQPTPLAAPIRTIRLHDIHLTRDSQTILAGIDLSLSAGRMIAITGPSGAGKSTLAELLLGLLAPDRGTVELDRIPLANVPRPDWHARIAWLPQRPTLFHGTLAENLRLRSPQASDADLRHALHRAAAISFVDALPLGLETMLGDHGQGLSGGQRQRVALARTLLGPADLVLLDEPTAALDAATAAEIARTIRALTPACATLVLTHDARLANLADETFRLEAGRLLRTTPARRGAA